MNKYVNTFLKEIETHEIENFELYFCDYLSVPRAERVNIYYNIINTQFNLKELESRYGNFFFGYDLKTKSKKEIKSSDNFLINQSTDVCIFYTEYRIVFLLDISMSLFLYDCQAKILNIEKIEIYLKNLINEFISMKKIITTPTNEKIEYSPKLIVSFVAVGADEDCDILSHEIYLDKTNVNEYFEHVMRKLKRIIMDFNQNAKKTRPQTSYLNKMLDQSLYILDLLPRSAAPILIILSDSNLYMSRLGRYNNILMQFNRVDININYIDIFNSTGNMNLFALGLISNKSIMSHISKFTGGCFFSEEKIAKIAKAKINEKSAKLPFGFSSVNKSKSAEGSAPVWPKKNESESSINFLNNENNNNNSHTDSTKNNNYNEAKQNNFKNIESVNVCEEFKSHSKEGNELITLTRSKCKNCDDNVSIFFCKKPYKDKQITTHFVINNQALKDIKKSNSQINFSLNFLDLFKRYKDVKIFQKETFEKYSISIPIQSITISRIRESFQMIKNVSVKNEFRKVKYEIALLPDVYIKYIVIGKPEKNYMQSYGEKTIKIKIKSFFYIFNNIKLEYLKNKNIIDKLKNNNNKTRNQKGPTTNIEKILKFIKEIYYTDKLLINLCQNFTLDKEYNSKENLEKDNFINANKNLWKTLENLSLHVWHRFFNVETLELMIVNKKVDIQNEVKNFFREQQTNDNNPPIIANLNPLNNISSSNITANLAAFPNQPSNSTQTVFSVNSNLNGSLSDLPINTPQNSSNTVQNLRRTGEQLNSPTNSTSHIININYNYNNNNAINNNFDFLKPQMLNNNNSNNNNCFLSRQMERKNYENKAKAQCEKILFNNCDIKNLENNFGIKLNHRTINNSNKKFMNGFCMVKVVWIYENVALIYLAFFQTFINVRRKFVEKIIEDFHSFSGDFQITCNNRHIVLLVPPLKSYPNCESIGLNFNLLNSLNNSNFNFNNNNFNNNNLNNLNNLNSLNNTNLNNNNKYFINNGIQYPNKQAQVINNLGVAPHFFSSVNVNASNSNSLMGTYPELALEKEKAELLESQSASIFTYRPYKKLIDSYIFKKSFKYSNTNKFIMEKFVQLILKQRLLENFNFLNSNTKSIILVTKISVSKVKNIEEIENNKIISKRCLMIYILQLNEEKDELTIELSVEPVSGYYLFKFSERDIKIYDERKFFNALSNYYKNIDKEIFDSIKNFVYLMRESIYIKLCRENILNENSLMNAKNSQENNFLSYGKEFTNSVFANNAADLDNDIADERGNLNFNNASSSGLKKNFSLHSFTAKKYDFENNLNNNFYNIDNNNNNLQQQQQQQEKIYNGNLNSYNINSNSNNFNSASSNFYFNNFTLQNNFSATNIHKNNNTNNNNNYDQNTKSNFAIGGSGAANQKKTPKHDHFINSYLCFKNEDTKLNNSQLKHKIDIFRRELKDYCENILDDSNASKTLKENANLQNAKESCSIPNIAHNLSINLASAINNNNNINQSNHNHILNNNNINNNINNNNNNNNNYNYTHNSNNMSISNQKIKHFIESLKQSLPLVHEIEYKILEKRDIQKDISYIERLIVDRFYWYFAQLFESIMDSKFEDEENCTYYIKVASKTSLILLRFPSIDKLLACCKNQSRNSHDLVIHIKFFILSIEKLKQSETKFAEILSEKASLKTLEFFGESEPNGKSSTFSSFWDDNNSDVSYESENKFFSRNDVFDIYPNQILNNLILIIDELYKLMYHKNNLMTYIENAEGDLFNVLNNCLKYNVNLDISDLFNCEIKFFMNNNSSNLNNNLNNNNNNNLNNMTNSLNSNCNWNCTKTNICCNKNKCCVDFDFIQKKIFDILFEHFKYLTCNFYCNDKINLNNLLDSGSETNNTNNNSFTIENETEKHNCNTNQNYNFNSNSAAALEKAKDLFIIELDLIQNFSGCSETTTNILLNDKEKYFELMRDLSLKIKALNAEDSFSVCFGLKIYFIPDIEDVYSEMNFDEFSQENYKMSCINLDNYSLYFQNTDNVSVLVPAFIKMQSNDYYVCINKKQKNFIRDIYNSVNSLKYLNQLENIRISYNYGFINDRLDYDKILEKLNLINSKNFLSKSFFMKTFDKTSTLKFLEKEEAAKNLIRVRDSKSANRNTKDFVFYMFDFEFSNDLNVQHFKKFVFEKYEKYLIEDINYKIPIWMTFSLPNFLEPNRRKSFFYAAAEKYSEDEHISFEIKILNVEFLHENNEKQNDAVVDEIFKKAQSLLESFVILINKKILLKNLLEKNICDEKLFPLKTDTENILSHDKNNQSHSRNPSFFHEVLKTNPNIIQQQQINQNINSILSKDLKNIQAAEPSPKNILNHISNKQPIANNAQKSTINNLINANTNSNPDLKSNFSASKLQRRSQQNYYLELQFNSKYKIEFNIEDVFNLFLEDIKAKYRISNREDVFRLVSLDQDKSEVYLFRTYLDHEDKLEKKSFAESTPSTSLKNIKNLSSSVFRKSAFSSFSVFDESKHCSNNFSGGSSSCGIKYTFINIEFYGLQKPSNKLVNLIGDIIIKKKNLVKLSKCNQILRSACSSALLEDLGIVYQKVNLDQKSLFENALRINETANELHKKAKSSWSKIFRSNFTALLQNNINDNNINNKNNNNSLNRRNSSLEILKTSALVSKLLIKSNEENTNRGNNVNNSNNNDVFNNNNNNSNYNNNINTNNNNNGHKIFGESRNNTPDDFSNIDLKLIYEFSDKVNLTEIYPSFKKISNISKNFAEDMIEYFKILKNNDIIVFTQEEERKKTIIIPELNQYCFFVTITENDEYDANNLIKYEFLKKKENIEAQENIYELIVSKNDLLLLVCKILDNLLYISFLLFVNINTFYSNSRDSSKSVNNSKISNKQYK